MGLKFESGLWVKTILNLGSEYLMKRSNTWSIQIKTIQKFLKIHMKIKCHKRASRLLQPDQRQKQNHNRENLLIHQLSYDARKKMDWYWAIRTNSRCVRSLEESDQSPSTQSDSTAGRQWSNPILEKLNFIFEIIPHKYSIGLMIVGILVWHQEEVQKGDISIALIREQLSISELFRDTLEIISLILRYRTMWWLAVEYSITSTTLDVHSIFTPLSTMDWYLEVRVWAEDRQYSSCPLIQETKIIKILNTLTSLYHVKRDTCTVHGRSIKTRYSGLILILRSERD